MPVATTVDFESVWRTKPDAPIYDLGDASAVAIVRKLLREARTNHEPVRIVTGDDQDELYEQLATDVSATASATDMAVIYVGEDAKAVDSPLYKAIRGSKAAGASINVAKPVGPAPSHYLLVGDDSFRLVSDPASPVAVSYWNNESVGQTLEKQFKDLQRKTHAVSET